MQSNNTQPFQILALSGGGYLGLYSAYLLEKLEDKFGAPIANHFDLIAGTSVGGILALGIAAECPAQKIRKAFEKNGQNIFSKRKAPTTLIGTMIDLGRNVRTAKYHQDALRDTIAEIIGEETLIGDLKQRIIIPSVNLSKGKPQIFKTPHHRSFGRDKSLAAVDVALATSAAPTYFPLAKINGALYADGGLYANSPDLCAFHEATHFLDQEKENIRVLSIGTTTAKFSFSNSTGQNLGWASWMRGQRLTSAMIASQQFSVDYMLGHILRAGNYIRIDQEQSKEQERHIALDVATKAAQDDLNALADASFQEWCGNTNLINMFANQAPQANFLSGNIWRNHGHIGRFILFHECRKRNATFTHYAVRTTAETATKAVVRVEGLLKERFTGKIWLRN